MSADEAREQEHTDEADRLRLLPVQDQRAIIAMHRADAENPKVPKRERDFARERAVALERLLGLKSRKRTK